MEAWLSYLVLDIATALLSQVAQHFGEHKLQLVAGYLAGGVDGKILVVVDVEGGAIEVARLLGGIFVGASQAHYVGLGAQYATDNHEVERQPFRLKAVEEVASDVLQQQGSVGHEIGDAGIEAGHGIVR